jgi:hypothetical protein
VEDWLTNFSDADDDDDDMTFNIDGFPLPTISSEPASATDLTNLTALQSEVLRVEDDANDLALRRIVPSDTSYIFDWSMDRNKFYGNRETFTGTSGPTFELTNQTRMIDVFDKMIDIDFIDRLCKETNRYAEQKIALLLEQNKIGPNS